MSSSASVPLEQALPWLATTPSDASCCWLVCDSVETNGRFLLHTMALQTLSKRSNVYWLACGPWTAQLIAAALKKMGCEAAAAYLRDSSSSSQYPMHIQSVTANVSLQLETSSNFDTGLYMKELYHSIHSWIQNTDDDSNDATLFVVDDASALATLVGERLTYCFFLSLRALVKKTKCNIVIRCSQDYDIDLLKQDDSTSVRPGGSLNVDWVCAGGATSTNATVANIPWERTLVELADGIVNVETLASGYSREAHGRLVFVSQQQLTPIVMNYCCQDTTVSAIRLRGPNS